MARLIDYRLLSVPVNFRLSWGKLGYSRHVFITMEDDKGRRGKGEGVLYKTTHLELLPFLEGKTKNIHEPGLNFAYDTAARDIAGKILKPDFNYSVIREIFLEDNEMEEKVLEYLAKGTKTVKLKVGAGIEKDKKSISAVNKIAQGKLNINLDANRAYSLKEATELALWGKKNSVVLFEEPVNGDFGLVKKLKEESGLPVMLDESIQDLDSLDRAIAAECFDILNIKLTRLGGITVAKKYVSKCQKNNIRIYLGCSEELEIGTAAIFSLAKEIKNLYAVEGFGTERINPERGFSYSPGKNNRELFLFKEFIGVWKTRLENAAFCLWPN